MRYQVKIIASPYASWIGQYSGYAYSDLNKAHQWLEDCYKAYPNNRYVVEECE